MAHPSPASSEPQTGPGGDRPTEVRLATLRWNTSVANLARVVVRTAALCVPLTLLALLVPHRWLEPLESARLGSADLLAVLILLTSAWLAGRSLRLDVLADDEPTPSSLRLRHGLPHRSETVRLNALTDVELVYRGIRLHSVHPKFFHGLRLVDSDDNDVVLPHPLLGSSALIAVLRNARWQPEAVERLGGEPLLDPAIELLSTETVHQVRLALFLLGLGGLATLLLWLA